MIRPRAAVKKNAAPHVGRGPVPRQAKHLEQNEQERSRICKIYKISKISKMIGTGCTTVPGLRRAALEIGEKRTSLQVL